MNLRSVHVGRFDTSANYRDHQSPLFIYFIPGPLAEPALGAASQTRDGHAGGDSHAAHDAAAASAGPVPVSSPLENITMQSKRLRRSASERHPLTMCCTLQRLAHGDGGPHVAAGGRGGRCGGRRGAVRGRGRAARRPARAPAHRGRARGLRHRGGRERHQYVTLQTSRREALPLVGSIPPLLPQV